VSHFFGDPSIGKSAFLGYLIKGELALGGAALVSETEGSRLRHFAEAAGVDLNLVEIQKPGTLEELFDWGLEFLRAFRAGNTTAPFIWGVDSVAGNTRVLTPSGERAIRSLVGTRGQWIYCIDDTTGCLVLRRVKGVARTGVQKSVLRDRFGWHGPRSGKKLARFDSVVVTPDHEFKLVTGEYKRAADLAPGDRLLSLSRFAGVGGWVLKSLALSPGVMVPESRFVAGQVFGPLAAGEIVHHRNRDVWDNRPENLQKISSQSQHIRNHWQETPIKDRPELSKKLSEAMRRTRAGQSEERRAEIARIAGAVAWVNRRADPEKYAVWKAARKKSWETLRNNPEVMQQRSQKIAEANRQRAVERRREAESLNHVVLSVSPAGRCDTFDLTVEDFSCPNFVANGVVVHNSLEMIESERTFGVAMSGKEGGKYEFGGGRSQVISAGCRKMAHICSTTPTSFVLINQVREAIGVLFGDKRKPTGGKMPRFFASVEVHLSGSKYGYVQDTQKRRTGRWVHARVVKNKVAPPFGEAEVLIDYWKGVHRYAGLLESLELDGLVAVKRNKDGSLAEKEFTVAKTGEVLPQAGFLSWCKSSGVLGVEP